MKADIIKVKSIKKIDSNSKKYDITTNKTHNFFANNILIHNSLGLIFYHDNQWKVSTKGSFKSDQAKWAKEYFDKNIKADSLDTQYVYLVEIIYPENRIVIPYEFQGLVLLSVYHSGYEYSILGVDTLYHKLEQCGFYLPKTKTFNSIEEILKEVEGLKWDKEGFVVRFLNGYRIKIKGNEYLKIHKILSHCTPIAIWEMMLNKFDSSEILKQIPEEMRIDFENILQILTEKYNNLLLEIIEIVKKTNHMTDKEVGLSSIKMKSFIFNVRKNNFLIEVEKVGSSQRLSLFKLFYPKGNILDGFKPTNTMNRFLENNKEN